MRNFIFTIFLMAGGLFLSSCTETIDSSSVSDSPSVSGNNVPTPGSNERAYYDDGCGKGTSDAKASMSMAYERHAEMYDSRFEPYFKQGYEVCWRKFR